MIKSIFKEYYTEQPFSDRFITDQENGVDIIIPVYHTNELWHINLISIYREIPVKRLLISDGGCIDDSIEIVEKFPRVEVFNHRKNKSLGKCIAQLIEEVQTEWFIYLHSDVYLPPNWFDSMLKYQSQYDWYGCPMDITVLLKYRLDEPRRPYAGSQMGRTEAFRDGINLIDDDYVYRQEDFVFNRIVEDAGYKTGKVEDTFHYHQLMFRRSSGLDLQIKSLNIETDTTPQEKERARETQLRGIVKYTHPKEEFLIDSFKKNAYDMLKENPKDFLPFRRWIKSTNKEWLEHYSVSFFFKLLIFRIGAWLKAKLDI